MALTVYLTLQRRKRVRKQCDLSADEIGRMPISLIEQLDTIHVTTERYYQYEARRDANRKPPAPRGRKR